MVCFDGKDPTQGASHGCQNKRVSSISLGDGLAGTVPNAVIRLGHPATIHTMSWPVLRLTLTASSSRMWPHRPATYVATSTWGVGARRLSRHRLAHCSFLSPSYHAGHATILSSWPEAGIYLAGFPRHGDEPVTATSSCGVLVNDRITFVRPREPTYLHSPEYSI